MVEQVDETHFVLKHKEDAESEEFKLELVEDSEGKPVFKGMPDNM